MDAVVLHFVKIIANVFKAGPDGFYVLKTILKLPACFKTVQMALKLSGPFESHRQCRPSLVPPTNLYCL